MTDDDSYRGTGRTVEAIKNAPSGAIYVWPTEDLAYPRGLCQSLERGDIRVVSLSTAPTLRGLSKPIVYDHACAVRP